MALVERFLNGFDIVVVPVGREEYRAAARAHNRFGKGRDPARLNMGDGFAYACARTHAVPLLFRGEDFGLTDVVGT
jgi:ribonuclease VapC